MAIRSLSEIIDSAVDFITARIPNLSVRSGTVARDVVIESPAQEFDLANQELDRIQGQQTLDNPDDFENDELEGLAESVGLSRQPGVAATGTAIFRLSNFSATSDNVTIPVGTELATTASVTTSSTASVVSFVTTAERTFFASQADTYFNTTTNFYELAVPIQATIEGPSGNVGSNTITTLITSITGGLLVTNSLPTSGGIAEENNTSLLERIKVVFAGRNVGTVNGLTSLVNENVNVVDSLIVVPGDDELVRDQFGNAADVVIIGEILTQVSESLTFTAGQTNYILSRQPLSVEGADAVSSVTGTVGGSSYTFTPGTEYAVRVDLTSISRNTTSATTYIEFLGSPFPDAGTSITLEYSVNSLVESLQTTLNNDDNKIIGTDILVREADKILVKVSAQITTFPGFFKPDVIEDAVDNVAILLNESGLDSDIDRSDIVVAIQNTPGVDSVNLNTLTLETKGPLDSGFSVVSDISIGRTEYARPDADPGAITIT